MSQLTHAVKLAYWIGQFAEGLKNSSFGILLLFYYNQVLGVPGTLCGIALLISTSLDAVTDPLMGSISDGWRSAHGRRHPFMYASALPLALCFWLLFNPQVSGELALAVWLGVFAVASRLAMTLYHVPHLALGAEMTADFNERTRIVAMRQVFGMAGHIFVYVVGFAVFFRATEAYPNGQLDPQAYPIFTLLLAALMLVSILWTSWGTRSLIPGLPQPAADHRGGLATVVADLVSAVRNPSFAWLLLGFLAAMVPLGMAGAFGLYVYTFFWKLSPVQLPVVLTAVLFATLLGYFASAPLMARFDKKPALMLGLGLTGLFAALPVSLGLLGWFPEPGTTLCVMALVGFGLLSGMSTAQLIVAVSSMMADVADEHELTSGKRQEGVFFGAFAFANKATAGLGSALGGIALDLIAWPRGEGIRTAADVPADALLKLAVVAGPVVGLALFPTLILVSRYSITRARHAEIRAELSRRAATAEGQGAP